MRPDSTRAPSGRSLWPWLLAAFVLLAALPILLFCVLSSRAVSQVESEQARIRAAGEPTTPADLEAFYAPPPQDKDVTQLWLAAIRPLDGPGFVAAAGNLPIVGTGEGEVPPPGQPWPQLEAAEKLLAQYKASLAELHEAADQGGAARYPTSFSAGYSMLLTHVQSIRGGVRLLALEAQVRAHRGDAAGAAQSIHALFRLAGSLEQEPILISQLVRAACDGMARDQIRQLLPAIAFGDDDLNQLQADLRGIRYAPAIQRGLLGERMMGSLAFADPATLCEPDPGILWRLSRQGDYAYYQQVMGKMIAACQQPWPQARQQVQQVENDVKAMQSGFLTRWQHAVTAMAVPSIGTCFDAGARGDAGNAAADAAIAIEFYRRREGQVPERLDLLVPDFLPQVPIDPFDGQPLRFVVRPQEYVLYSIGPDGKDDGGEGPGAPLGDYPFRVRLP